MSQERIHVDPLHRRAGSGLFVDKYRIPDRGMAYPDALTSLLPDRSTGPGFRH